MRATFHILHIPLHCSLRNILLSLFAACAAALCLRRGRAASPAKSVRIVVPFPPAARPTC